MMNQQWDEIWKLFDNIYQQEPQVLAKKIYGYLQADLTNQPVNFNLRAKALNCVVHDDQHASVTVSKNGFLTCWPCNLKTYGLSILTKFGANKILNPQLQSTGKSVIDQWPLVKINNRLDALVYLIRKEPQTFGALIEPLEQHLQQRHQQFDDDWLLKQQENQQQRLYQIVAQVLEQSQPNNTQEAYLNERGLDQKSRQEFKVGVLDGQLLVQKTRAAGISDQVLIDEMLLLPNGQFGLNGIVYLLQDKQGMPVGFSARYLPNQQPAQSHNRFISAKNSTIYKKGDFVYGLNWELNDDDFVCLTEGQQDAIALKQVGINAVATMGIEINRRILDQLKGLQKQIVWCYDGDQAGMDAMKNQIGQFLNAGLDVNVFVNPYVNASEPLKDVDQVAKRFQKRTKQTILQNVVNGVDFWLDHNLNQNLPPAQNADQAQKLLNQLTTTNKAIIKQVCMALSKRTGLTFNETDLQTPYIVQVDKGMQIQCANHYQLLEAITFLNQHPAIQNQWQRVQISQGKQVFNEQAKTALLQNATNWQNWKQTNLVKTAKNNPFGKSQ